MKNETIRGSAFLYSNYDCDDYWW